MFTGIIEGLGQVMQLVRQGKECRLKIRPLFAMEQIVDGESIAVNGACLSVETHGENYFTAYASGETLSRTNLESLKPDAQVNLERALALGGRLGGHIVSGHIDCLARVQSIGRVGQSLRLRLSFPVKYGPQIIAKGSVALNGISLTVNDCGSDYLEVNIIPDSQKRTNLPSWRIGSQINMETDIIGKYVQRLMQPWDKDLSSADFLARHGLIN